MSADPPLPLGYAEQRNPPPRPSSRDPAVRRAAAEDILPEIIDWYGKDWREAEREAVIADLVEIVGETDGYRAARALEQRCHWEVNAALVEILDSDWTYKALNDAIREWVKFSGITPKFRIGDIVNTRHGTGPITRINADEATYTVQTDEFLRGSPGQASQAGGYVIRFEDCEATP